MREWTLAENIDHPSSQEGTEVIAEDAEIALRNGWSLNPDVEVPWQTCVLRLRDCPVVVWYQNDPRFASIKCLDFVAAGNAVRLELERHTVLPYLLVSSRNLVVAQGSMNYALLLWVSFENGQVSVTNLIGSRIPIEGRKLAIESMEVQRDTLVVTILHVMPHGTPNVTKTYEFPVNDLTKWAPRKENHTNVQPGEHFMTEDLNPNGPNRVGPPAPRGGRQQRRDGGRH